MKDPESELGIRDLYMLLLVFNWIISWIYFLRCFKSLFTPSFAVPCLRYFFQSSVFIAVLVHTFPACFSMSSIRLIAGLHILLHPLLGPHIVAAFSQWLWSSLTTCLAHLHIMSCAVCEIFVICALFLIYAFLVCWSVISNISHSIFRCATCSNALPFAECPCWVAYNNAEIMHFSNISVLIVSFRNLCSRINLKTSEIFLGCWSSFNFFVGTVLKVLIPIRFKKFLILDYIGEFTENFRFLFL